MGLEIGKNFVVFRYYEEVEARERIPIILGPGRAFGSGEHETTFSCVEELEKISITEETKVLDLGCGTGILSIAAAKMGAQSVTALDTEQNAVKTTVNNMKLNGVENKIVPIKGELEMVKGKFFDLILANLYGDILISNIDILHSLVNPNGYILLSGILFENVYQIKTGFLKKGYRLLRERYLEEYVTMVFRNEIL